MKSTRPMGVAYTVIFTVAGYLVFGWGGALFFGALALVSFALGAWMYFRIEPS